MKNTLYLGTSVENVDCDDNLIHLPVVKLCPKSPSNAYIKKALEQLSSFSYYIFTSKNAVRIFFRLCETQKVDAKKALEGKSLSIGPFTSKSLRNEGVEPIWEAGSYTQEGMSVFFSANKPASVRILYPRSSRARPYLATFLRDRGFICTALDLYDTKPLIYTNPPSLTQISTVIFTSPSTVEGFFSNYKEFPSEITPVFQGPITESFFRKKHKFAVD